MQPAPVYDWAPTLFSGGSSCDCVLQRQPTLWIGDSTIEDKVGYLHDNGVRGACTEGNGVCLSSYCLTFPSGAVNRTSSGYYGTQFVPHHCKFLETQHLKPSEALRWDAVVWNPASLHALTFGVHEGSSRPVTGSFDEFYHGVMKCSARLAQALTPQTGSRVPCMMMLSNDICSSHFYGPEARDTAHARRVDYSRDPFHMRAEEEATYSMQFTGLGVAVVRVAEREAARFHGFDLVSPDTGGACDCSAHGDGRHYTPLIPHFLVRASNQLRVRLAEVGRWKDPRGHGRAGGTRRRGHDRL